jgi:hypothetical protein
MLKEKVKESQRINQCQRRSEVIYYVFQDINLASSGLERGRQKKIEVISYVFQEINLA